MMIAARAGRRGGPAGPGVMKRVGGFRGTQWSLWLLLAAASLFLCSCGEKPAKKEGVSPPPIAEEEKPPEMKAISPGEKAPPMEKKVFTSPLAGSWYPADSRRLEAKIQGYLDRADGDRLPDVRALILPHAGYAYSAQTAAYGLRQIEGRGFRRIVVMGPTHRVSMANQASVPDYTHYATILGEIPLDTAFIEALKQYDCFETIPYAHEREHSVQIELPLLQQVLSDFTLVPIVVGQVDQATATVMANVLLRLVDPETLVVVSSDFVHYGPDYDYVPFTSDIPRNLEALDMGAFEFIRAKNGKGFATYVEERGATICGRYAIGVLLAMLPEDSQAQLLHYDTSGAMTGDFTNSVSYLSVAFSGRWAQGGSMKEEKPMKHEEAGLSDEDKRNLLQLARETLMFAVKYRRPPSVAQLDVPITPGMRQKMGAFVTLHKQGQLRGCIGEIIPRRPVYEAVMSQAINAGLNDGRFEPVGPAEMDDLDFEISAYADPPRPVASYDDIVLGRDGIVLEKGRCSALFLPQVAPEQGWDLETTLSHLALKAGLPRDAWKQGASFSVFEAIVFGEHDVS